jgi:hypothetical protein
MMSFWELEFPDGGGGNLSPVVEGEDAWDICINRPCGTVLFDALYEIMRQTHTLMWLSGMDNMITADETIADHLPSDYIEKYGVPPWCEADPISWRRLRRPDNLTTTMRCSSDAVFAVTSPLRICRNAGPTAHEPQGHPPLNSAASGISGSG